ncbi:MAG: phosphoribosylanthranilate isomerase [Pseudomonadota bacterium]
MSTTWIKICGLTRPEDARHAAAQGVAAIGLVQVTASARYIAGATARQVREQIPAETACVLLFLNPEAAQVEQAVEELKPELLQFHGTEPAEFCRRFGLPYIKALSAAQTASAEDYPDAWALLLDSHQPGGLGGTGKLIDDEHIPGDIGRPWNRPWNRPWILAGGLSPQNVAERIRTARPFGVDVSSGVESRPGIKDPQLITEFVSRVRDIDNAGI